MQFTPRGLRPPKAALRLFPDRPELSCAETRFASVQFRPPGARENYRRTAKEGAEREAAERLFRRHPFGKGGKKAFSDGRRCRLPTDEAKHYRWAMVSAKPTKRTENYCFTGTIARKKIGYSQSNCLLPDIRPYMKQTAYNFSGRKNKKLAGSHYRHQIYHR